MKNGLHYLTADEYPMWDELVESSLQGSLFCRSWWLKATGNDVRVLAQFDNGRLIAGIPLHFKKRLGLTICTMPKLTQTWGVVIKPFVGEGVKAASREMGILRIFADHLNGFVDGAALDFGHLGGIVRISDIEMLIGNDK